MGHPRRDADGQLTGVSELASRRVSIDPPTALRARLARGRLGPVKTGLQRTLRRWMSEYDVNAWLDAYPMALLDTAGFERLLAGSPSTPVARLLDVGSGSGDVLDQLRPLARHVVALETAPRAAARLRRRGIDCRTLDLSTDALSEAPFELVSLMNVLDRAARPRTLLAAARDLLATGGRLLISTPIPIRPHVHAAGGTADPDEWIEGDGATFEAALERFAETVLAPLGLTIERWTRAEYWSAGDVDAPDYRLDAAVMVCVRVQ